MFEPRFVGYKRGLEHDRTHGFHQLVASRSWQIKGVLPSSAVARGPVWMKLAGLVMVLRTSDDLLLLAFLFRGLLGNIFYFL